MRIAPVHVGLVAVVALAIGGAIGAMVALGFRLVAGH